MCALILILSGHAGIFKTTLVPNVPYIYSAESPVAAFFSNTKSRWQMHTSSCETFWYFPLSRVVQREAYQKRCTDAIIKDRDYEIISTETSS